MDGTNASFHENLLTSDADVQTVNTLHGTQKTAVLNTNPVSFNTGTCQNLEENGQLLCFPIWNVV